MWVSAKNPPCSPRAGEKEEFQKDKWPFRVRAYPTAEGDRGWSTVFVPSIVVFELWYGVAKSSGPEMNRQGLETFSASADQVGTPLSVMQK